MKISPARAAAFDILLRVLKEGAFSSALLPAFEERLAPADRNLCHELVLGALRRKLYLDRVISILSADRKTDDEVRIALYLGIYQLLFLDRVPDHSAINDSVELVARARKRSAKGFVNAILRSITRQPPELTFANDRERLSVMTSHPPELLERWARQYGEQNAAEIAEANNRPANVSFRLLEPVGREISATWRASAVVPGVFSVTHVDTELRRLAQEGRVYFQDEGSQLVADSVPIAPEDLFLDVCAAPGGKTGSIANRVRPKLAVAGDIHRSRVRLLKQNLSFQCSHASVVQYDAEREMPLREGSFNTVLVDAPCSGTGTIRHNPEIRYSIKEEDIAELSKKQLRILANAAMTVKPGGHLVYSTCSLEREEGEDVIEKFLEGREDFRPERPHVPERFWKEPLSARTRPHVDDMDGFFIAAFTRSV